MVTGGDLTHISLPSPGSGGGHSVLAYGYTPRPGHPDSILVADPKRDLRPVARHDGLPHRRREHRHVAGHRHRHPHADYHSGSAFIVRIPSWVARTPAITPVAALALGVEQVLSDVVVVGGDAAVETVGLGGGASLTAGPLLDTSPLTRLYAGQGALPSAAHAILISRGLVEAGAYFRTVNVAAGARISFQDRDVNARIEVAGFEGFWPTLTADVSDERSPARLHIGAATGVAQRPGWSAAAEVTLGDGLVASLGFAPIGLGVVVDGLADGPAPQVQLRRDDAALTSRYRLDDVISGKPFELRPADMTSPFGVQVLATGGLEVLVDPLA